MAKNKKTEFDSQKFTLILFTTLAIGTILFISSTDVFTLFSVTGLTLDATSSKGKASDRGVDASSGIFKGQGNKSDKSDKDKFKEPKVKKEPKCKSPTNPKCRVNPDPLPVPPPRPTVPPVTCSSIDCKDLPTTITVIDLRGNNIIEKDFEGGGVLSSSTIDTGIQELIRNEVIVHDRFHTSANGQTTTGSLQLQWGHGSSITIQQFLVPNEFFDWFEIEIPQTIRGDGAITFDGISDGELKYKLTFPQDLIDKNNVIPVRLVINTEGAVVDAFADIEIERPVEESTTFSVAEFFRSLLTELRISFG